MRQSGGDDVDDNLHINKQRLANMACHEAIILKRDAGVRTDVRRADMIKIIEQYTYSEISQALERLEGSNSVCGLRRHERCARVLKYPAYPT